ncbi:MAG: SPOR domain-containing protein [Bryobacteraceae bacterium]|nr:SPOR domain-containing protein [Bryobacteraceae bacterium]
MPRNDDGEFELILGNKQLLSVFFIVVTLLAVFFAMGFIMGRSVNPVAEARKVDNSPSDKPIVVDAKPSASSAAVTRPVEIKSPIETEVAKPDAKTAEPPKADPKVKEQEAAKEAAEKKAEAKKAEREKADREKEAKAEAKKAEREKEKEKKTEAKREPVSAGGGKAPSGSYLQVAAVGKSEADLVVEVLAKKGFKAYVVGVDGKPDLYRVVVGPVKGGADTKRTMDDLQEAGFKPFPRKL